MAGTDGEDQGLETEHHRMLQSSMEVVTVMVVQRTKGRTMITAKEGMMTLDVEAMEIVTEVLKVREVMIDQMQVVIRNLGAVSVISAVRRVTLRENAQRVAVMMTREEV